MIQLQNKKILKITILRGGPGSGNFAHSGRPGEIGGSAPRDEAGGSASMSGAEFQKNYLSYSKEILSRSDTYDKKNVRAMDNDTTARVANTILRGEQIPEWWGHQGPGDYQSSQYQSGFDVMARQTPTPFETFRGLSLSPEQVQNLQPGYSFTDKGFSSTSSSDKIAGEFANARNSEQIPTIMRISVPKGSMVAILPNSANEIVLDKNTMFTVTKITKDYVPTQKKGLPAAYRPEISSPSFTLIDVTASNPSTNRYPESETYSYIWFH